MSREEKMLGGEREVGSWWWVFFVCCMCVMLVVCKDLLGDPCL